MAKKSFLVYYDLEEQTADLTDTQLGQLFRAMFAFEKRGEKLNLDDPSVNMAFRFVSVQLREGKRKYDERCEKNRQNGVKGGRPPKQSENPNNPVGLF